MIRFGKTKVDFFSWFCRHLYSARLSVQSTLTFSLRNSVRVFFFFWLGIELLLDYFQVVLIFLVFSFLMEFFPPDICFCNIFHCQIASSGVFIHPQNNRRVIKNNHIYIYIYMFKKRNLKIVFHFHNKFVSLIQAHQMDFHFYIYVANDTIKTSDTVLRKIYLSLYLKGLCVWGSWRPNRTATNRPPLLRPSAFLSPSPGLLNRGPRGPASLGHVPQSSIWGPTLLCAGFLYRIFTPTGLVSKLPDILSSLSYIIVQRPPSSCGHHKLHSFNPSTVKVIITWLTGCTCYLYWCISYFDSSAGS